MRAIGIVSLRKETERLKGRVKRIVYCVCDGFDLLIPTIY